MSSSNLSSKIMAFKFMQKASPNSDALHPKGNERESNENRHSQQPQKLNVIHIAPPLPTYPTLHRQSFNGKNPAIESLNQKLQQRKKRTASAATEEKNDNVDPESGLLEVPKPSNEKMKSRKQMKKGGKDTEDEQQAGNADDDNEANEAGFTKPSQPSQLRFR
jgi:hypothetical protein